MQLSKEDYTTDLLDICLSKMFIDKKLLNMMCDDADLIFAFETS